MQKRGLEALAVVALSALTLTTTLLYIHNQSQRGHEPTSTQRVQSTTSMTYTPSSATPSSATQSLVTQSLGTPSLVNSQSQGPDLIAGWSSADVERFLSIVQKLTSSLTATDIEQLQSALETGNEQTSQTAIMAVVNRYLTPSDELWLAQHLAGEKPFGPEDVQLLKNTLKELAGQLTPAEQQILQRTNLY